MASSYRPLIDRLAHCPDAALTLPLDEIAAIIGRPLSNYARTEPHHWVHRGSNVAKRLEEAGWWATLDAAAGAVTFRRGERPPAGRVSHLDPLLAFLAERDAVALTLPLEQVAAILGHALPPRARLDPAWWDGREGHARKWEALGWAARLDIRERAVTFSRTSADGREG